MNRSYRIGYAFQNRVKKHLKENGWLVVTHPKSAFPDHICWRYNGVEVLRDKERELLYNVIFVECKVNKYLSRDEKEKAIKSIKNLECNHFYVAYRKNRKLLFYELLPNGETKEVKSCN